jgi:endo-1,4-beta-xylanase
MLPLRRREFMVALPVLPAEFGGITTGAAALRHYAAAKNILFGSMVTLTDITDPDYASLVAEQCAIITPGIEAKWPYTEPTEGTFRFGPMDALAGYALGAGLRLHMHNLIWAVGLPAWTLAALKQGRGRAVMSRHIGMVAGRYRGRIQSWDVINETVDRQWPADRSGLLMTPWWHGLGPDFVIDAFSDAAIADPTAELMMNEDGLEYDGAVTEAKRCDCLRLVESWLRRGVKLRAFGLETHLRPWLPVAAKQYRRFLHDMAQLGVKLRITEFDIDDRFLPGDIATRDRLVAEATGNFLALALDETALDTLIVWGLTDRSTWMLHDRSAQRPDGMAPRPLPYDTHLTPKPMWFAIANALRNAPERPS